LIEFDDVKYKIAKKEDRLDLNELEYLNVFDANRFNKK